MPLLGLLNFLVFQWFFIRLARVYEDDGTPREWRVLFGIYPLTGWWSDYKYVGV